ncbi:unnamed protein product [Periconia digitata]|uniref:NACHT-NTPase and P-loop NTPases N-terminal domain-containing protein n=1 Tax=Periconia digitata TaxID=1303443 RepID=A0A9W4U9V0_9PLEO|nr:unnamed protein product [Periconia digitata]
MASPVSIGDAILLSKLAYRLAHTLTIGRKQAPANIKKVQDQLHSLGSALKSVAQLKTQSSTHEDPGVPKAQHALNAGSDDHALEEVIQSCRLTLGELEELIKKYDAVSEEHLPRTSEDLATERWKNSLKINWKKIRWTMEGEELDDIRKRLNVHIAALNLLVVGRNSSQIDSMQEYVHEMHGMLKDVHGWFDKNLKGRQNAANSHNVGAQGSEPELSSPTFRVSAKHNLGTGSVILCPQAWFREGWTYAIAGTDRGLSGVFQCYCTRPAGLQGRSPHADNLRCSLLPISLLVQLAGTERTWHMFCDANGLTSFNITDVSGDVLSKFQQEVDLLADAQAMRSLTLNSSTSFVCHSKQKDDLVSSVLDSKSDMSPFQGSVSAVNFHSNGRHFTQYSVDAIQTLHYRLNRRQEAGNKEYEALNLLHQNHSELVLYISSDSNGESRLTIRMNRTTRCELANASKTVIVFEAPCQTEDAGGAKDIVHCDKIEIECITENCRYTSKLSMILADARKVARKLFSLLQSVVQESQIHYLQGPRYGEEVVAERVCPDLLIDQTYLSSPKARVAFDPESKLHRLILQGNSLATSITMELPDAFLKNIENGITNEAAPQLEASFVQHGLESTTVETRIARFPMELLAAPTESMNRMHLDD